MNKRWGNGRGIPITREGRRMWVRLCVFTKSLYIFNQSGKLLEHQPRPAVSRTKKKRSWERGVGRRKNPLFGLIKFLFRIFFWGGRKKSLWGLRITKTEQKTPEVKVFFGFFGKKLAIRTIEFTTFNSNWHTKITFGTGELI